ncbi:MAG: chorismate synthase [Kiritimatiellaeota bacterium]|nr:chorismate synthase [Kiritimatiellota bacterium]
MFLKNLHLSLFGESHGECVGVVIEGLPPGFKPDLTRVSDFLRRRAPGNFPWTTQRKEPDEPRIISGFLNGAFTGAPLAALIANTDTRSGDYAAFAATPRPGHADYAAGIRYNGANDLRGGGFTSARLTAPLVFAGALAAQILESRGVRISARIVEIAGVDSEWDDMVAAIAQAQARGDSVGGIIEATADGFPAGIGDPFFGKLDAKIAGMMMGLPAVKGVEIGAGFAAARSTGTANNDQTLIDSNGKLAHKTNNAGGIEGGMSNGEQIVVRVAFKPTPSITAPQSVANLATGKTDTLEIRGRHDPCVVPRALPVVEAALALALLDSILQ